MRPAICCLCGKSAVDEDPARVGRWVEFINYVEGDSASFSHPDGLEYFCSDHLSAALTMSNIASQEALEKLKLLYPYEKDCDTKDDNLSNISWWSKIKNYFN